MIEQKKKLSLDELQVNSFVTKFDTQESAETNGLKGGSVATCTTTVIIFTVEVGKEISKVIC
jgi:hypothetical protein